MTLIKFKGPNGEGMFINANFVVALSPKDSDKYVGIYTIADPDPFVVVGDLDRVATMLNKSMENNE